MAGSPRFLDTSLSRPPPHLEGKLLVQPSNSKKWRERYCVVLEKTLHCYKHEEDYKRAKNKAVLNINLEEVFEIIESLHHNLPKSYDLNCVFKLRTEEKEVYLVARERTEADWWINGLRCVKAFWEQYKRKIESCYEEEQLGKEDLKHVNVEDDRLYLTLITIDGSQNKIPVEENSVVEDLFFKLTEHGDREGSPCEVCQIRKTGVEFWAVDSEGAGHKVEGSRPLPEVGQNFNEIFMLENHHKLLIVHFEDGTFQVCPKPVSITTREVLKLPILTEKLASIDCDNPGLFFATSTETALPFRPEEKPLEKFIGPSLYNRGKLVMKSKALSASPNNPGREHWMGMAEKIRIQKMYEDRIHPRIEEKINRHNIGKKRREENRKIEDREKANEYCVRDYEEGDAVPIKSKKAQLNRQGSLIFYDDHFTYCDSVIKTPVGDFVNIDHQGESNKKQEVKDLIKKEDTKGNRSEDCSLQFTQATNHTCVISKPDVVVINPLRTPGDILSKDIEGLEEQTKKEEAYNVDLSQPSNVNKDPFFVEEEWCDNINSSDSTEVAKQEEEDEEAEEEEEEEEVQSETSKGPLPRGSVDESCDAINDENMESNREMTDTFEEDKCELHESGSASSDVAGNCLVETKENFCDRETTEDQNGGPTDESDSIVVKTDSDDENLPTDTISSNIDGVQDIDEHYCDFYKVETPNILRMVLKNQADDHVTRDNKMARICLSGAHFVYRNCKWHFQGNLEEVNETGMDNSLQTFRLNAKLVTTYDKVRRCWTVSKDRNNFESQGKCDVMKDRQSVKPNDVKAGTTLTAPSDQKSVTDCRAENTGNDFSLTPSDANCNIPQSFLDGCNVLKSAPLISSKQKRKKLETDDKENVDFTISTASEPVGVVGVKQDKTVNEVLRDTFLEETDYASFCQSGSLRSRLINSSFSSDDEPESAGLRLNLLSIGKNAEPNSDECLVLVRGVYQQITRHMSKLNPEDALDDSRCKVVGELIYEQLVPALWSLIARGLRKPKFWQSKITPWTIVSSTTCPNCDIIRFVEAANCYSLTDEQKFKFFVCKCLNYGRGTLEVWFTLYYRQLKTVDTAVRKCYEENFVDEARLRGRSVLEELISEVSRLSYLPFRLCYPRQVQERGLRFTCQTVVSYE